MAIAPPSLPERASRSSWVAESPGLADDVRLLHDLVGHERQSLVAKALELAQPGPPSPGRALRHFLALQAAQFRWGVRELPAQLAVELAPLKDPSGWAREAAMHLLRDQLAMLGPPGAEIARQLEQSEGIAPGQVVDELRARPVRPVPMADDAVGDTAARALGHRLVEIDTMPRAVLPLSQLHDAVVDGRAVLVRVRRPGTHRDLADDIRLAASVLAPLEDYFPAVHHLRPTAFVELAARHVVEASDLRHEALNAVEVAIAIEELGITGVEVVRPLAGLASGSAAVFEPLVGVPLLDAGATVDTEKVVTALVGLTVEAALARGVFPADLAPENLTVLENGALGIVGLGSVGHFDTTDRRGLLHLLMSLMSGNVPGMIDALHTLDAVPIEADVAGLATALAASERLKPMALLLGGEQSLLDGLKEALTLALRHRVRPPVEVALFVRNLFALRALIRRLPPGPGLMAALMPMVQRLPGLAADLDS